MTGRSVGGSVVGCVALIADYRHAGLAAALCGGLFGGSEEVC